MSNKLSGIFPDGGVWTVTKEKVPPASRWYWVRNRQGVRIPVFYEGGEGEDAVWQSRSGMRFWDCDVAVYEWYSIPIEEAANE